MSRKDYVIIASYLREMKPTSGYQLIRWRELIDYLIVRFTMDNSRFDADRFNEACHRG